MLRNSKYFVFAVGVLAGLIIGLVYAHARICSMQKADQTRIKEINMRLAQTQQKYTQGLAARNTCDDERQAALTEKEKLAAENKLLKAGTDSLTASVATLKKKVASSEAKAAQTEAKNGKLAERLAAIEADRHALDQKQSQTLKTLQEREKDVKQLDQKYNLCAENNARLYVIGNELIGKYQNKSFMTTVLEKEPFTQIKRVELEKLVRDYRDKIDQQKVRSK